SAFGPRDAIPQRRIRPLAPTPDRREAAVEKCRLNFPEIQDRPPHSSQNPYEVIDAGLQYTALPRTGPEEQPGVPLGGRARLVQQVYEPVTYKRIVADAVVGAEVAPPEPAEPGWLGPEVKDLVAVIL